MPSGHEEEGSQRRHFAGFVEDKGITACEAGLPVPAGCATVQ